ncbi:unnamed protein product [Effrenium voratum]|nr:unnamed protein product [Effrenium voratum]|mmetsp:Transcript_102581/g.244525  ORF Transcript_102581/g.244525 Transcript_102581/m.244525 type:complete len:476 (+) Transcript_102581:89-1516(+)
MPRAEFYSLDGDAKLAQMMGVTPSSLMAMLKQNVDLKQFGVSAEFAETAKAVYEAVTETSSGDDILICCCCCYLIGECLEGVCLSSGSHRRRRALLQTQMSEPGQQSMDIQPEKMSLLGLASKISSGDLDVKELLGTEDWSKKERFALWMFGKKFGSTEESKLRQCVEKLKQVLPEIAQQDNMDMEEIKRKGNTTNVKVLTSLARSVATAAMLKHGANVSNDGLGAMGLAECAPVLCAGDLKYELDATGLHKCVWQCPAGQVPDTFESAGADLSQSGHDANVTLAEAESMHKVAEEEAGEASSYSKGQSYKMLQKWTLHQRKAYTDAPLKLFQMTSVTELGPRIPVNARYSGTCRAASFQVNERVVYTGSDPKIPHGAIVKIERLPGSTSFMWGTKNVKNNEYEVKYLGEQVIVRTAELKREDIAPVQVDPALQEWLRSTGGTIQVAIPGPGRKDPGTKQDGTLWFPVSSAQESG